MLAEATPGRHTGVTCRRVHVPGQEGSGQGRDEHVRRVPPGRQQGCPQRDALKKMGGEVRRWRINLRTTTDLAELAEWMNPVIRLGDLLRQVLQDRAGRPPAAHQHHLPGALGSQEVQAAAVVQTGQKVWNGIGRRQRGLFAHWAWMTEF